MTVSVKATCLAEMTSFPRLHPRGQAPRSSCPRKRVRAAGIHSGQRIPKLEYPCCRPGISPRENFNVGRSAAGCRRTDGSLRRPRYPCGGGVAAGAPATTTGAHAGAVFRSPFPGSHSRTPPSPGGHPGPSCSISGFRNRRSIPTCTRTAPRTRAFGPDPPEIVLQAHPAQDPERKAVFPGGPQSTPLLPASGSARTPSSNRRARHRA